LAAALLSFGSTFHAAQVLHVLLDESRSSRESLPTLQQLKDIFGVLEHKISCAGFTESLQGWDMLLKSNSSGIQNLFIDPDDSSDAEGNLIYNSYNNLFDMGPAQANVQQSLPTGRQSTDGPAARSKVVPPPGKPGNRQLSNLTDPVELFEASTTLLPRIEPATDTRATKIFGVFRKGGCPPANSIAKLIRAMAEVERIGEASSAVLRTPANTAAWCIAFIRWCLGTTPTLRVVQKDGTCTGLELFKPHSSKFIVEIGEFDSKAFHVRTFHEVGKLDQLLWESRSMNFKSPPWAGMVKVKVLFQHRLRDLQTRHDLFHVIDALLVLARELTSKFCITHESLKAWTPRPFPESDRIIDIIADLFDVEKVISHVRGLETSQVIAVWNRKKSFALVVAELFLDILILSCFAAHESEGFENLHVSTEKVEMEAKREIVMQITAFLRNERSLVRPIEVSLSQLHKGVLSLAGAFQECLDGSLPLISSKRGQVVYFSLLETMTLMPNCPLQCRVYQGRLQYDGQYYDYATGEPSELPGVLETSLQAESTTTPVPYREQGSNSSGEGHWFGSTGDNYIKFYLAPDLDRNFSMDPRSFIHACASTIILSECLQSCVPLEDVEDEILYCSTIGAAVRSTNPRILRVITCGKNAVDTLFVQVALMETWTDSFEIDGVGAHNCVTVTKRGGICLPCACRRTLDILQTMFEGHDVSRARAVIIA
jgi:hypothetical protein